MAPPSSAKEKAVKMQVTAARTNETTTAGPASATLSDSPTKIPVPTIAPTPKHTSWKSPMVRRRLCPSRSAPDSASSRSGLLMRAPVLREGLGGVTEVGLMGGRVLFSGGAGAGPAGAGPAVRVRRCGEMSLWGAWGSQLVMRRVPST